MKYFDPALFMGFFRLGEIMHHNGSAMNSTGANWRLLFAMHIAKSFGFVFLFLSQAKSKRFCGLHKNTQTMGTGPLARIVYRCC